MNRLIFKLLVVWFNGIPLISNGQQILLTNETMITLRAINYDVKNPFGEKRVSISEKEEILFEYDSVQHIFTSKKYTRESLRAKDTLNKRLEGKQKRKNFRKKGTIPEGVLQELCFAFQSDLCPYYTNTKDREYTYFDPIYCDLSNKNYGVDINWLNRNITLIRLIKIAKDRELLWNYSPSYLTIGEYKELHKLFKSYVDVDSFNVFLSDFVKPRPINVTHHFAELEIEIIQGRDTVISMSKNLSLPNRPVSWLNNITGSIFYNPKVEMLLDEILPEMFLLRRESVNYNIKESYLNWILDRV